MSAEDILKSIGIFESLGQKFQSPKEKFNLNEQGENILLKYQGDNSGKILYSLKIDLGDSSDILAKAKEYGDAKGIDEEDKVSKYEDFLASYFDKGFTNSLENQIYDAVRNSGFSGAHLDLNYAPSTEFEFKNKSLLEIDLELYYPSPMINDSDVEKAVQLILGNKLKD